MLAAHIYINGNCMEAIELYKTAFNASVKTLIHNPEKDGQVLHSEILIHDQLLMLNDFGDNDGFSKSGGYQLSVRFENTADLKRAYSILEAGSMTIFPLQATDYSPSVVRFIDKYDVRWAFWV